MTRAASNDERIREQVNSEWNATVEQMEARIVELEAALDNARERENLAIRGCQIWKQRAEAEAQGRQIRLDAAEAERDALADALLAIRDHDSKTCQGIDANDCLDMVQETARAALERVLGDLL